MNGETINPGEQMMNPDGPDMSVLTEMADAYGSAGEEELSADDQAALAAIEEFARQEKLGAEPNASTPIGEDDSSARKAA